MTHGRKTVKIKTLGLYTRQINYNEIDADTQLNHCAYKMPYRVTSPGFLASVGDLLSNSVSG